MEENDKIPWKYHLPQARVSRNRKKTTKVQENFTCAAKIRYLLTSENNLLENAFFTTKNIVLGHFLWIWGTPICRKKFSFKKVCGFKGPLFWHPPQASAFPTRMSFCTFGCLLDSPPSMVWPRSCLTADGRPTTEWAPLSLSLFSPPPPSSSFSSFSSHYPGSDTATAVSPDPQSSPFQKENWKVVVLSFFKQQPFTDWSLTVCWLR